MKTKFITILLFIFIFICSVGYGYIKTLEFNGTPMGEMSKNGKFNGEKHWHYIEIVCIDGYKYAIVASPGNNGISIIQMFEQHRVSGNPIPVKCN